MQNLTETLDFSSLNREEIEKLLRDYNLNLSVDEALTIQNEFLKRPPTISECVLWSIQGSEHCSYKSSRIHLKQFNTSGPHVILGAKEDAGIVSVAQDKNGYRYGVIVSHESHNHPSQIVPYEGAATGVGGNVRDVCCMGGEVIAVADSLRFGDIKRARTHWIQEGVVSGIAGYGNPLGIPNIAGDVYYDPAYNENCLVTVVTLGIVREDHIIHSYAPPEAENYVFILVGKPTDNSGFGGASFASTVLEEDSQEKNKGAVQEPNAFLQRHLLKANYSLFQLLREKNLIDRVGFKDLGAGGVACASIELAEAGGSYGAEIDLDKVPTGMPGLMPSVILCSETQERFMWVVPPDLVDTILKHYNETFALPQVSEGARAAVIGKIRTDGLYVVNYKGRELVRAKVPDVTKGIVYNRPHASSQKQSTEPVFLPPDDYNQILLQLLAHENIASKEPIFEMYDKQVQGRTLIQAGWADAGVLQPFNESKYPEEIRKTGIALSLDQNPRYNKIDAYWGAVNAVVESVRNITAVGATPVAITDCLCFGNPEKPEQMREFVDSVRGISDACAAIYLKDHPQSTLPVIAGNVSLYNESVKGAIPPSPMISCLGTLPDIDFAITFDFKKSDSLLILIGERKDECGGSVYYQLHNQLGSNVPKPDLSLFNREIHAVSSAIQLGLVNAAHDVSEGGVAVALAEMSFKNSLGVAVQINGELSTDKLLFGETGGFILEIDKQHKAAFDKLVTQYQVPYMVIGHTTEQPVLQMNSVINLPVEEARQAWGDGLRERLL
ncbi:TPA: phosphoribosylformylglycinamidine synthase subunit PurL [Legionella pneumophila subsp. pneumophila]|uniref:Phosphoribosylformylglycinamidine synthase subunit PurL n=1 Tax=Legionella pneumophila (strain Lens) TaxID=297245 RepID=Q5WW17_LEGPL|nr:phosphoribosylformylglycinamidine synthase subunit PurL [Legionella pneumophila]AOW51783.1 phosphoribosylformylglycinamidine synthase II [Legionella pneumophila subsp. pneumophila]AOW54621.1 phosphoribosylformylglycinamidine synthase II [Legionella pneumophila subsp. pneumophila]AOW57079.1 phosphoribosylformylglycinamidine synthase II [Legionella pneumophila subsp. pneumophila]AOW59993.1 phosphoribosylformylglycinamidine synthase II [Legionella pneumophila subsp. pneumophila]AOW62577.1 phos